jgi:hypothetical protein
MLWYGAGCFIRNRNVVLAAGLELLLRADGHAPTGH